MSDEQLLAAFRKWVEKAGRSKTLSCLTARNLSPTTAELLATGDYKCSPKRKLRAALIDIMKVEKAS